MTTDPIADLLTRIRNAQRISWKTVRVPSSKLAGRILEVLREEGFISGFRLIEPSAEEQKAKKKTLFPEFEVELKYYNNGDPMMGKSKRVSKPGLRKYTQSEAIPSVSAGLGMTLISTSQGIMSGRHARGKGIGGEILAIIQ